ncbi:hypothetical protein vBBcePLY3_00043 [Bacillus phage vB_BceP_LY3]|uniref:Uncharacterized protein n=1 Tax=Bacillus phage vB_BceP_LY3 TaxID=2950458 RepID=A0AAE9S2P4_9CAUD|nr:hypothetical protein vBBcePLY3_00043 [Bacillus phage vB_BceP_LY3]
MPRTTRDMERKTKIMKTIHRNDSRYKPSFNFNKKFNYISDDSLTNLIKRVDEICDKYNYDYDEPIYKVVETNTKSMNDNSGVRLKSRKTRYTGAETMQMEYFEVRLRKVV